MIDVYRSASGRDAVARWSEDALAAWPTPHTSLDLDVVPRAATIAAGAGAAVPEEGTDPVPTHVVRVGEGPPRVVVLPDTGSCAAALTAAADAFADDGPVWLVDVPGQPGLSSGARPRHGAAAWTAAWLDGLLAQTGATDGVLLVGHSSGALAALGTLSPHVRARLLVAPAGVVPFRTGPRMARDSARWLMRATEATSHAVARQLLGPASATEPEPRVVDWLTVVGRSCRSQSAPRPLPRYVIERALAVPTVVAVGDDDCYLSAPALTAALTRRDAADLAVEVLDGVGHLPRSGDWARIAERAGSLRRPPARP